MGRSLDLLITLLRKLSDGPLSIEQCQALTLNPDEIAHLKDLAASYGVIINQDEDGVLSIDHPLDFLDQDYIYRHVTGGGRVSVLDAIDSTNSALLRSLGNTVSGDVILAELQTAGRGRRGSTWYSTLASDLIFSLVFEFDELKDSLGLSLAAGLSIIEGLKELGYREIKLKWPNDLYYNDRKLCGILVETAIKDGHVMAVIGAGLNFYPHDDPNFAEKASSLSEAYKVKSAPKLTRTRAAVKIINALKQGMTEFKQEGFAPFYERYDKYDLLCGRHIKAQVESKIYKGTAFGINEDGELLIDDGRTVHNLPSAHIAALQP